MTEDFYIRNPLRVGMCGDDVRYIQEVLNTQGFDIPVTGVFDDRTMSAARRELESFYLQRYDEWPPEYFSEHSGMPGLGDPRSPQYNEQERDQVFSGDEGAYQRWGLLQESWRFSSREEFRDFLQSTPSPIPDQLYLFDADRLQRGIPATELPAPMNDSKTGALDVRNTDVPPVGGEPYCSIPMSDAGGGTALAHLSLYDEIRSRLPDGIGDERAYQATLRAMQDGIKSPEQLEQVVVANDRIFAVGTTPGVRGVVDLNQPAPSMAEMATQFAALDNAAQAASAPQQDVRTFARL